MTGIKNTRHLVIELKSWQRSGKLTNLNMKEKWDQKALIHNTWDRRRDRSLWWRKCYWLEKTNLCHESWCNWSWSIVFLECWCCKINIKESAKIRRRIVVRRHVLLRALQDSSSWLSFWSVLGIQKLAAGYRDIRALRHFATCLDLIQTMLLLDSSSSVLRTRNFLF